MLIILQGGGIWNEKCPKFCVFLTFPLLRCTSFVPWLSSPCLFSGPRCPPTGFDLFPLLIICCLILDINNQSSYSLIFFAPSKGSTPSLFLFFFPLLIWASQVMMMIMVFIFNLSVSSYTFVNWFLDFCCPGSIYTMMAVAIERYITVCHPFFKITHNWGAHKWVDDDFWIFALLHHQVHFADLRLFIGVQCAEVLRTEGWGGSRLADFPALFFQLLWAELGWVGLSRAE